MYVAGQLPPILPVPPGSAGNRRADALLLSGLKERVDYAFQPIVSLNTGGVFAFEALLRGHEALGFATVPELIDRAYEPSVAMAADQILRQAVMTRFAGLRQRIKTRLFLNIDNRMLASRQFDAEGLRRSMTDVGIDPAALCVEISEARSIPDVREATRRLRSVSPECLTALDDFGVGYSGLQLLYDSQPHVVKIDRFFISGIAGEQKKKLFVSTVVQLAHVLGIKVVAEGIETEAEFRACREIGCDFGQGYWIARPTCDLTLLEPVYAVITDSNSRERRARRNAADLLEPELDKAPPLSRNETLQGVFEAFRHAAKRSVIAVTDGNNQPVGVIRESILKEFVYSPFGKELLQRRAKTAGIGELITPCVVCDIGADLNRILDAVALRHEDPCVVVVDEQGYVGLLHHTQLLRLLSERNMAQARNQSPLTRLPGNLAINEHIVEALQNANETRIFAYFDFNNFKPFNDRFGFRLGDRAILLFADLMRRHFGQSPAFLGHIGGDDFFLGLCARTAADTVAQIAALVAEFDSGAATFYDAETRAAGFVGGFDRSGAYRRFPLLSVSCATLILEAGPTPLTLDDVSNRLATLKGLAKATSPSLATECVPTGTPVP
jgi:EAL domain-containing protein (putative c-di-GMP-specific phosphodiesterase class I)/GGDEF domain-containing protein